MKLTDFNTDNQLGYAVAAATTVKYDLIELCGLTGEGLLVGTTDYAAVSNCTYGTSQTSTATGQVITHTTVHSQIGETYSRQQMAIDSSGNIFVLTCYSSSTGITLKKYAPSGALLGSVDVDTTATTTYSLRLVTLSNGNLCVSYNISSTLKYAIYDTNLLEVKALTTLSATALLYSDVIALSGGGFAAVFAMSGTPLESKLATFDNAGTAVLAATIVWTRTGTTGNQFHRITQLSSGNIAYAISSVNTVSSIGLYYGVTDVSGAIVKAFTSLDATSISIAPELVSNGAGYFAIARPNSTNQVAWVFNNAGTEQGSSFSSATSAGNTTAKTKLVASGTTMYLLWHKSSTSKAMVTSIPITGTGHVTGTVTTPTTQYNFYLDAFYEDGYIVAVSMPGASAIAPQMWVVDTATMQLVNSAGTTFGTAASASSGTQPRVLSGGDRTFIAVYDYTSTSGTFLCAGKWANTAILGVAEADTATASSIPLRVQAGAYKINTINGTKSKAFDMSATNLVGNKGAMVANGFVTLTGIGV